MLASSILKNPTEKIHGLLRLVQLTYGRKYIEIIDIIAFVLVEATGISNWPLNSVMANKAFLLYANPKIRRYTA